METSIDHIYQVLQLYLTEQERQKNQCIFSKQKIPKVKLYKNLSRVNPRNSFEYYGCTVNLYWSCITFVTQFRYAMHVTTCISHISPPGKKSTHTSQW